MHRDVVESARFPFDFDHFSEQFDRMDDVHLDVTWTLAHSPWSGDPLDLFPDFRVYITTPIGKTPAFRVLYEVTETQVILHAISVVD